MNHRFTPERIASGAEHFVIPIYQRLFEWDSENVSILLNDLYHSFKISPQEEYCIGLLTSTADGDLVDGQQRFTVMSLLACIFHEEGKDDNWGRFIGPDCNRLEFRSRSNDAEYLKGIFNDGFDKDQTEGYINNKMRNALLTIKDFISDVKNKAGETEASKFIDYVFQNLSFFISPLPQNYSARDLNKYFERMNSTGKNLEQHEILKVKMLRNLDGDVSTYMRLWNLLSRMNKLLIRKREGETEEELRNRKNSILSSEMDSILSSEIINGLKLYRMEDGSKPKSIREIMASPVTPKAHHETEQTTSAVLSFPQLLLLTLYWKIKDDDGKAKVETKTVETEFFNTVNLLETFQKYLPYEGRLTDKDIKNIKDFMLRLTRARVIFDSCFVRSSEWGYTLEGISEEALQLNANHDGSLKKLQMLEAMIYVSTPSKYYDYRWFMPMVKTVSGRLPSSDELWQKLKDADDKSHSLPLLKDLSYGDRIRYWLWRLDYYIWSNRRIIFKDNLDALRVASNYSFVRNRSLEHVAPQHPESNSTLQWNQAGDEVIRDSFGNMVMISGGMNSSLKNQAYEVKKAHVQAYISNSKNGSIESLSLLALNTFYDKWDRNTITEYGEKAYKWLEESFMTNETQA